MLRRVVLLQNEFLEGRANAHQGVEEARVGKQHTEGGLFDGGHAQIGGDDGARFKENVGGVHAGRTIGLTGAAQKAAGKLFVHRFRVFDEAVGKVLDEGDLAARQVAFDARGHVHRTKSLTETAFHAGRQLVVESHQSIGQLRKFIHEAIPFRVKSPIRPNGGAPPAPPRGNTFRC